MLELVLAASIIYTLHLYLLCKNSRLGTFSHPLNIF